MLPQIEAKEILRGILRGLKYLHDRDIAHRDIKPSNILMLDGQAHVADLGLAQIGPEHIFPGQPLGTPGYMAPEVLRLSQAHSSKPDDLSQHDPRKADIWALGDLHPCYPCNARDCYNGSLTCKPAEAEHWLHWPE